MKSLSRGVGVVFLVSAAWILLLFNVTAQVATLQLGSPANYQVFQRVTTKQGTITVTGSIALDNTVGMILEARLEVPGAEGQWRQLTTLKPGVREFHAEFTASAGGWYRMAVRVKHSDRIVAEKTVEHVGVGEIFVIAGQSNSANHGEERQKTSSGLVAASYGGRWQLANDPQPGASGEGGSFIPPFGDALAGRFKVPIGIVAAGIGATSVREWLPRSARFPNPPTLTGNVTQLPDGEWEARGDIFASFIARMKALGPKGFRAVLWHQGESDANQSEAGRTLSGELYRKFLTQLIHDSRREVGWDFPWFVAQATYHTSADTGSADIRAAQASLWKTGAALEGPDTDALTGRFRDNGGKGIHLSGEGLREHAARWVEKVSPWMMQQLAGPTADR